MLTEIPLEILHIIILFLHTDEDKGRLSLTCKKIYTFCRNGKDIFDSDQMYENGITKDIRVNSIRNIIIKSKDNKDEVIEDIRELRNLKELKLYYILRRIITNDHISTILGLNLRLLRLIGGRQLELEQIESILGNNKLEEVYIYMHTFPDEYNRELKVGKSYKRISIVHYGLWHLKVNRNFKIEDKRDGLKMLEFSMPLALDINGRETEVQYIHICVYNIAFVEKAIAKFMNLVVLVMPCDSDDYGWIIQEKDIRGLVHLKVLCVQVDNLKEDTFVKMTEMLCLEIWMYKENKDKIDIGTLKKLRYLRVYDKVMKDICIKNINRDIIAFVYNLSSGVVLNKLLNIPNFMMIYSEELKNMEIFIYYMNQWECRDGLLKELEPALKDRYLLAMHYFD
jgi:hypothetical protein